MKPYMRSAIILFLISASACSPGTVAQTAAPASPQPAVQSPPTAAAPAPSPTPTADADLFKSDALIPDSPFCEAEDGASQFTLSCENDTLSISESENRRGSDIFLTREQAVETTGFNLQVQLTSDPADKTKLDKNQVGFYFVTKNMNTLALRIEGQYFNFEEWYLEGGKERVRAHNQSYSPAILSAGRKNELRLVCMPDICDFYANGELAGRLPIHDYGQVLAIGFFTASDWDQRFGTISLENFSAAPLAPGGEDFQPYTLADDLTADHGTFAQMGLSGAFSDFEADGFHFSPVIPYGYYGAKTGPSLRNVSVSADINMDFAPGQPGTRYGGVVCRASNEGMYLAILRVDGTYTIFRDSIRKPFALLAEGTLETITAGRSSHTIRLDCVEDTISLYINDGLVESFTDTKYDINYGRSGFYTKAGGAAYSDAIIFSNLVIKERVN